MLPIKPTFKDSANRAEYYKKAKTDPLINITLIRLEEHHAKEKAERTANRRAEREAERARLKPKKNKKLANL